MLAFPESRECPGCDTLAYMGDNPDVCAACYLEREKTRKRPPPTCASGLSHTGVYVAS